jgi:PmbA protein
MKKLSELRQDCERAVAAAKKAGATSALARVGANRNYVLKTKNDDIELLKESQSLGVKLRLYVGDRFGVFSTSEVTPEEVASFAEKSVAMVKMTDPDPARGLPDPRFTGPLPEADLDIFDADLAASRKERSRSLCEEMTRGARSFSRKVMHVETTYSESHGRSVMLSSDGFAGEREATSVTLGASAYVKDGKRKQSGYDYRTWRHFDDASAAEIGPTAARRASDMVGSAPLATGRYPIVIVNYWGDYFTRLIVRACSGAAVYRNMSCLGPLLGKEVASPHLTLIDDPLVNKGLGSRRYDSEGMAAVRFPLVEQGVLKGFYFSSYWARKQGTEPTTEDASNITFGLGDRTGEQMVASLDRGLLVTGFIGGNFNPTSGDFSAGIRGFLVEDGKRKQPIIEMNLAGNLLEVLPRLEEVGNDPYPYMSIRSPALRFKALTVSGT